MTLYRKTKMGWIETLHTVDNYRPKGWCKTKQQAMKKRRGKK